jgi:hypothetical protein
MLRQRAQVVLHVKCSLLDKQDCRVQDCAGEAASRFQLGQGNIRPTLATGQTPPPPLPPGYPFLIQIRLAFHFRLGLLRQ